MPYAFNVFTGELDLVGSVSGGTGDPGGSNGSVQYNNNGAFGGFGSWNPSGALFITGPGGQLELDISGAPTLFSATDFLGYSASYGSEGIALFDASITQTVNISGSDGSASFVNGNVIIQGGTSNIVMLGSSIVISGGDIIMSAGGIELSGNAQPDAVGQAARANIGYFQIDGFWPTLGFNAQYSSVLGFDTYIGSSSNAGYRLIQQLGGDDCLHIYSATAGTYGQGLNVVMDIKFDPNNLSFGTNTGTWEIFNDGTFGLASGNVISDISGNVRVNAIAINGGTSSQFLKADGSTDSTGYYKSGDSPTFNVITQTGKTTTYNNVGTLGYGHPAIVDTKTLTNQGADITTTNFVNSGTAGLYRISYNLQDTTSDITAGAVTLTIAWTDGGGATTVTATQVLTGTGRTSGSVYIQLVSGNITYATSHTGIFGSAKYALYLTSERLN